MNINWGIADPNAFQRGYQQAKGPLDDFVAQQEKARVDNALRQYATNPNDPNAVNALAQVDPRLAIQVRQQQQAMQAKGIEAHRENILKGAQIVRQMQPKDDASWQQTLNTARSLGIDVSQVPQQFDAQYVQGLVAAADAFEPQKAEASPWQVVTPQPGGGALRVNRQTGEMQTLLVPNPGDQPMGAPATKGGGNPGAIPAPAVEKLRANPGLAAAFDEKYGPGSAARALGGQSQPAAGNFLDPLAPLP